MPARSDARYGLPSLRLSLFAANERFGMTLEIVGEHPQRSGRTADLPQRIVQLLDLCGISPGEIGGVVERTLRTGKGAARAYEREIKIGDCFAEVVADLVQGHLADLVDDVL